MDILKNQIRKLSEITVVDNAYENVEEKLQLLGKTLITDYIIKIGDLIVEPLWVEAYYSNVAKGFVDPFIHGKHGKEEQSKFVILYFHHKTDDPRSGVDICLSLCNEDKTESKYFLSERIKPTILADGSANFKSRSDINQLIARTLTASMHKMHRACQDNYYSQDFIDSNIFLYFYTIFTF